MTAEKRNEAIYSHELRISVGTSRKTKTWKQQKYSWGNLLEKLRHTQRTNETYTEYMGLSRARQSDIKDVGGFVGGILKEGQRKRGSVAWRWVIALDADHVKGDFATTAGLIASYACALYSTHKHNPDEQRLRLIIPLSDAVTAEQYEPVARKLAESFGIDQFDDTTYQAHRLMYWPSSSSDAEFIFEEIEGELLDPETILNQYEAEKLDWRDPLHWPRSSREGVKRERELKKAGDPLTKKGLVGAFCRVYTIADAIAEFIPDIYTGADESRYTFAGGSTFGGLVIYEDGLFAYSHHESDPCGGLLCNAFDLIRLHLFGDKDTDRTKTVTQQPSYRSMTELAQEDKKVKHDVLDTRRKEAAIDFAEAPAADPEATDEEAGKWIDSLEMGRDGKCTQTIHNVRLVLENDPELKGKLSYNLFSHQLLINESTPWHKLKNKAGDPWNDSDDSGLRHYLERSYGLAHVGKIQDAVMLTQQSGAFHPVREYLESLEWDGVPRADTLLIDYLAASDSEYTRAVTRKMLAAGVARIMDPGCKFDYMLVLYGKQGIGKSLMIQKLAGKWYSDSVTTVSGKEAYEQLQGAWLLEMAELTATRKAETEAVKHFISKSEDMFRVAYGRHVTRFPRQCIFIGTTNDAEFLRDRTGNRRYWPITVGQGVSRLSLFEDLSPEVIGQVWAEAVDIYMRGEQLFLSRELEAVAASRQARHLEDNPKRGQVLEFLDLKLPNNWDGLDIAARRRFIHGSDFGQPVPGKVVRDKICALEILTELFQKEQQYIRQIDTREINEILQALVNWEEYTGSRGRMRFGSVYGTQKAFTRVF